MYDFRCSHNECHQPCNTFQYHLGQCTPNMPSQIFLDMAHQTDIQGYHNVCNQEREDQ